MIISVLNVALKIKNVLLNQEIFDLIFYVITITAWIILK